MDINKLEKLIADLESIDMSIRPYECVTKQQLKDLEKVLYENHNMEFRLNSPTDIKWYIDHYRKKLESSIEVPYQAGNLFAKDSQIATIATKHYFVYRTLILPDLLENSISRIKVSIDRFSRIYSIVRINNKNVLTYLEPISKKPSLQEIEFVFLRPEAETEILLQDELVYFTTLIIDNKPILVFYKKRY